MKNMHRNRIKKIAVSLVFGGLLLLSACGSEKYSVEMDEVKCNHTMYLENKCIGQRIGTEDQIYSETLDPDKMGEGVERESTEAKYLGKTDLNPEFLEKFSDLNKEINKEYETCENKIKYITLEVPEANSKEYETLEGNIDYIIIQEVQGE